MTVYAANFTMKPAEISAVTAKVANYTSDPFGSPVFQLRGFLGL